MCGFFSVNSFIVSSVLLILHLPEIRESEFSLIKKKQKPKQQSLQFLNKPQSLQASEVNSENP